jgi:Protein of unknown function (DUF2946)
MKYTRHQHAQPLHRLWATWLAVLLALFAALAPTVSHALALDHATQSIEICSSTGAQTIPADSPAGPESTKLMDHCPFCLLQADRVAPPPSPVATLFLVQGGQQEDPIAQVFFYVPDTYSSATPRGPPAK